MVFDKGYIREIYFLKVLMSHYNKVTRLYSWYLTLKKIKILNFDFFPKLSGAHRSPSWTQSVLVTMTTGGYNLPI
jgi:hypothetical protein